MKRIIALLFVVLSLAAFTVPIYKDLSHAHEHGDGWCQQPITRNTWCPNPPLQGSNFCASHQPTPEARKGDYLFSTCMSINPICFNQAAPGSNFCSLHIPPPMPCRCTVPIPGEGLCARPCVAGNLCERHMPPDLKESEHVEPPIRDSLQHN